MLQIKDYYWEQDNQLVEDSCSMWIGLAVGQGKLFKCWSLVTFISLSGQYHRMGKCYHPRKNQASEPLNLAVLYPCADLRHQNHWPYKLNILVQILGPCPFKCYRTLGLTSISISMQSSGIVPLHHSIGEFPNYLITFQQTPPLFYMCICVHMLICVWVYIYVCGVQRSEVDC